MAPKRLSETEKQEIADRYRQPDESTATLSRAFGVSTSTIGRLLKNSFSADEYETLVQQKRLIGRGGATRSSAAESTPELHPESNPQSEADATESETASSTVTASPASSGKPQQAAPKLRSRTRSRSRSRTSVSSTDSIATSDDNDAQLGLSLESNHKTHEISSTSSTPSVMPGESEADKHEPTSRRRRRRSSVTQASQDTSQKTEATKHSTAIRHVTTTADESGDHPQDDETPLRSRKRRSRRSIVSATVPETDFTSSELSQEQEWQDDETQATSTFEASSWNQVAMDNSSDRSEESNPAKPAIEILDLMPGSRMSSLASPPLSEATLPKTCYLVVDRLSELISRPLQDFEELGEIPQGEHQEQTLPIFDNHRVARRFANRSQRVMKIPDSRILQKTGAHLQAKGITRVLIDGKVYSLS